LLQTFYKSANTNFACCSNAMFLKSADLAALNGIVLSKLLSNLQKPAIYHFVHAMEESIAYSQLLDDAL
jgi:hypothetical protein